MLVCTVYRDLTFQGTDITVKRLYSAALDIYQIAVLSRNTYSSFLIYFNKT